MKVLAVVVGSPSIQRAQGTIQMDFPVYCLVARAGMQRAEEQLDEISDGKADWRAVMRAFWEGFSKAVEQTKDLKISDVINALDQDLGPHFFPAREDGSDPRQCAACGNSTSAGADARSPVMISEYADYEELHCSPTRAPRRARWRSTRRSSFRPR